MPEIRRPALIAGNWKMNGLRADAGEVRTVIEALDRQGHGPTALLCPPATLIDAFARLAAGSRLMIGAQDCHVEPKGAFTGDLSAEAIKDAGASHVIVGHSERRTLHGETDAIVAAKATAADRAGLTAIVCVGETLEERKGGRTGEVLRRQIAGSLPRGLQPHGLVIAYEPVWAIGTGLTPSPAEIVEAHANIAACLGETIGAGVPILYGGSVKSENAREILALAGVGGALVGGASLKARDFLAIIAAAP